jgi:general secretion pathway protein K
MIRRTMAAVRGTRQRGIALLTALFVVALATIAATAMVTSDVIALHRAEGVIDSERAWWYALGVESWTKAILVQDLKNNKIDALNDIWAQPVAYFPIDNGSIRGHVEDLQGRFNLNALQSNTNNVQPVFQRLLDNIPGIDPVRVQGLGMAIQDWLDVDSERAGLNGFEDSDYLGLDPPYRAANQLISSPSELMAVHGMTLDLFQRLQPYVCALPGVTASKINVNTAPLPVLLAIAQKPDAQTLSDFVKSRVNNPVNQPTDVPGGAFTTSDGGTSSDWFLLQQEVTVGSARVALYSVIKRPSTGGSGGQNGGTNGVTAGAGTSGSNATASNATGNVPVVVAHQTGFY